jgi:hypothetical protein
VALGVLAVTPGGSFDWQTHGSAVAVVALYLGLPKSAGANVPAGWASPPFAVGGTVAT